MEVRRESNKLTPSEQIEIASSDPVNDPRRERIAAKITIYAVCRRDCILERRVLLVVIVVAVVVAAVVIVVYGTSFNRYGI